MGFDEDRAKEGVQHLQNAAKELIEAARAFLDVAEELVDDPAAVTALLTAVGKVTGPGPDGAAAPETGRAAARDERPAGRVERIHVG